MEPLRRGCDCTIVIACGDVAVVLEAVEIVWRHHYLNVEVVDPCSGVDAICESAQRTHRLLIVDRDHSLEGCSIDIVLDVLNTLLAGSVITSARCAGWDTRSVVRAIEKMFNLSNFEF